MIKIGTLLASQYTPVHQPAPRPFLHAGVQEAGEFVHLTGEQSQILMGLICFWACCGARESMRLQWHRLKLSSPNCTRTKTSSA